MDEASARQVFLAQAIETADPDGRLMSPAEREQADRQARQDALQRTGGRASISPAEFIQLRAQRVLAAVGVHQPAVVALQHPGGWRPWIEWGMPVAALVTGVLTDVVANPHRLDLLSLPLLGIVAWNVVMYVLLLAGALMHRRPATPWVARLGRWGDGGRSWRMGGDDPRVRVSPRFHLLWLGATEALHLQRVKRVLHVSAAAWALGVIFSLLVRGLVVEYRVGWESTFLGPEQVHTILSVLRLPALLMLPFEPFTVTDIAHLRFSDAGGATGGAPWVWMYVALLVTVVVLPRLFLATFAAWRENRLERRIAPDLADPYYERIVSLLNATRVRIALLVHRAQDRDAMLRVLVGEGGAAAPAASTEFGDVLLVEEPPFAAQLPAQAAASWWQRAMRFLAGEVPGEEPREEPIDAVVQVVASAQDLAANEEMAAVADRPVLTVRMPGMEGEAAPGHTIGFDSFAASWVLHQRFFDALGLLLPASKLNGYQRIVSVVQGRHAQRLRDSMAAISRYLLDAARQSQELPASALTVKHILPGERQAQADARQVATDAMVSRLRESSEAMFTRLRELHAVDQAEGEALEHQLEESFLVQQSVDAPQAGMAGAATGAAMGASVDLLAGGMTLGAAAALGALVGGGAAYIAAAWKNRSAPGGATLVQLSDGMLDALAAAALMRYVAIVQRAGGAKSMPVLAWQAEVTSAVKARVEVLAGYWSVARTQPDSGRVIEPLAGELEKTVMKLFERMSNERV